MAAEDPSIYRPLAAPFFARSTLVVAKSLLGRVLVHAKRDGLTAGRIVEVEAYDESEPSCHAFVGETQRNRAMFGPAGHAYIYRSYGIHWCMNVVTARPGYGAAVLLRALHPLAGVGLMLQRRGVEASPKTLRQLASGPGRLCAAMGISDEQYGSPLTAPPLYVADAPGRLVRPRIKATPRIGISKATELRWRFCIAGDGHVSGPKSMR